MATGLVALFVVVLAVVVMGIVFGVVVSFVPDLMIGLGVTAGIVLCVLFVLGGLFSVGYVTAEKQVARHGPSSAKPVPPLAAGAVLNEASDSEDVVAPKGEVSQVDRFAEYPQMDFQELAIMSQLPSEKQLVVTGDWTRNPAEGVASIEPSLNKVLNQHFRDQWGCGIQEDLGWGWLESSVVIDQTRESITREESGYEVTLYRSHYLLDLAPERLEILRPIWRWFVMKQRLMNVGIGLGSLVAAIVVVLMVIYLPRRRAQSMSV